MLEVLDLGLKQSSPLFTHVLSTVSPSKLRESKKSVFAAPAEAFCNTC